MKQQKNSGFSLIEVIIAMAIFTIGTLGLYGMQINSAMWNTRANQQTSAVLVASQMVEQLMRADYNNAALDFTATTIDQMDQCHNDDASDDDCHDEGDLQGLTFVYAPGPDSLIKSVGWVVNAVLDNNNQPISNMKQVHVNVRYGARDREADMSFLKVNLPKS